MADGARTLADDIGDAWRRIFDTPDGKTALLHLRQVVMTVGPVNEDDCALRDLNGTRRFAAQLIGYATRPEAHDERRDLADDIDASRRRRESIAPAGRGAGVRRRVPESIGKPSGKRA